MKKKIFDKINGREVYLYTIKSGNIEVDICDLGARINALRVGDIDVALGFNSVKDYLNSGTYAGATIERVANRIAGGRFILNGRPYFLNKNDGENHLHGGNIGFDKNLFDVLNYTMVNAEHRTKRETDLCELKIVAKWLLMTDVHTTEFSPVIVHHPFASSGLTILPETNEVLDITSNASSREKWREYLGKKIDKVESAYDIFMMLNKTYALTFIKYAKDNLSTEDLSQILADAWIQAEAPNMDVNVSKTELVGLFSRADKQSLMTETERKQFADLPNIVTVYRGVTSYNAKNVRALSWTFDRSKAEWFAHRFGEDGTVYQAQINKTDILAIFTSRGESEVVVNPKKLIQLKKTEE